MALQLIKMVVNASINTNLKPNIKRCFHVTNQIVTTEIVIDAADFFQDDGSVVTTLPALDNENSYYNVFINGVMQMGGISTYTPGGTGVGNLTITIPPGGDPILSGTPIVLEIGIFTPESNTTINT
ncbi:DUF4183 domain-containing protein [Pseudalkalibacillus sp. SCS-8]|uniref:DUF4183 domain-containing protein n=1 Tax=Pseudalkalibacillus nanhaiensis TaxID=3115291 RepID=UPI0032DA154D